MKVRDAEYLRKTLKHSGLTYREIEARTGVDHSVVANLARGARPGCTDDTARKLAEVLRVELGLLFVVPDVQDKCTEQR